MPTISIQEKTLAVVARLVESDEVSRNPDVRIYDTGLLDSMKTVELIVALSEAFSINISPAELDREEWATPRKIAAYVEQRVSQ